MIQRAKHHVTQAMLPIREPMRVDLKEPEEIENPTGERELSTHHPFARTCVSPAVHAALAVVQSCLGVVYVPAF
jgi:hypothetical protein